jgi:adenylate kinase
VDYFREKDVLVEVDGERAPGDVWTDVRDAVAERAD